MAGFAGGFATGCCGVGVGLLAGGWAEAVAVPAGASGASPPGVTDRQESVVSHGRGDADSDVRHGDSSVQTRAS